MHKFQSEISIAESIDAKNNAEQSINKILQDLQDKLRLKVVVNTIGCETMDGRGGDIVKLRVVV